MAVSLRDEELENVKELTVRTSATQAGFVGQMSELIFGVAQETQYKPIMDIGNGMKGAVASKLIHTLTDKTGEVLRNSKISFSNILSIIKAGATAEEKMDAFGNELVASNEEAFEIKNNEPSGAFSSFDVDEQVFAELRSGAGEILDACIAFNAITEATIRENMSNNIIYAPILVFHICRSAIIEHFLRCVFDSLKRLENVYLDAVDEIRNNRADIQTNINLDDIMNLAAYGGVNDMNNAAGSGGERAGGNGAGGVPVPVSLDNPFQENEEETDDVPFDMKSDGDLFDREGKLKYFMYNFIDGCAIRTDSFGNKSALEEFTDWVEHSMRSGEISCAEVSDMLGIYSSYPDISEAVNATKLYCDNTQLSEAADSFGAVADYVRTTVIPENDESYNSLCDIAANKLFGMIDSEVTYGDYIDYKRMKGEVL